jgi:hypothetical protein
VKPNHDGSRIGFVRLAVEPLGTSTESLFAKRSIWRWAELKVAIPKLEINKGHFSWRTPAILEADNG